MNYCTIEFTLADVSWWKNITTDVKNILQRQIYKTNCQKTVINSGRAKEGAKNISLPLTFALSLSCEKGYESGEAKPAANNISAILLSPIVLTSLVIK